MASFGGESIFGTNVTARTVDNPRAAQVNAFPGLSGTEELDQGSRGRFTVVTGRLSGDDASGLNANIIAFRSFNDGLTHDLVDTFGNTWSNVKYESFELEGRVRVLAGPGFYYQDYTARFKHL